MKNPFESKSVTPVLLLLQFAVLLTLGILCIVNDTFTLSLIEWAAVISLAILGISKGWGLLGEKKYLRAGLCFAIFLTLAVVMVCFPRFFAVSTANLFALWFLITGGAKATICIQAIAQDLPGKFRSGFSALLSLVFAVMLFVQPTLQLKTVFLLAGIYLLLYACTVLVDVVSEIFLFGTAGAKVKTKLRISLPLFLTAMLPGKMLDEFNAYFQYNPKEAAKYLRTPKASAASQEPLEVFIHLSDKGAQRTGHVDLRYRDTVYSYGCYDHHAHRFGGMMSDGTMVVLKNSKKYIEFCLKREEKILVGFGLSLTKEQCRGVERALKKITGNLVTWQSDFEKRLLEPGKPMDAASQLVAETGAKIYKMAKGPFRSYYALNTNCVKLADQIIGTSGLGLICVGGIAVPGSYYTMLNDLYEKNNSLVTQRNIYKALPEKAPKKRRNSRKKDSTPST